MLSRMAPSSPPVKRTLHLLKTPDILCANDNRPTGSYCLVLSGADPTPVDRKSPEPKGTPAGNRRDRRDLWLICVIYLFLLLDPTSLASALLSHICAILRVTLLRGHEGPTG